MTAAKVAECLKAAIGQIGKLIPGGWENVSALNVKTASSVALPVWVADPAGRWTGMEDDDGMGASEEDASAGEDDLVEPAPAPTTTKKAKAPAPVKKAKTVTEAKLVAPAPPHPASVVPAPASKAESKKKTSSTPAVADKKKVSGQSAGKKSIKESVVGKKGGPKQK